MEAVRATLESKIKDLQTDNGTRLEEMRKTVDEKLHATLEQRLGESFKLVSDRLEKVHQGLGEMQQLAIGVGDLKRVLTNVKTRGTWGEVQLEMLLEQILTPEQYSKNVETVPGTGERVEFAHGLLELELGHVDGALVVGNHHAGKIVVGIAIHGSMGHSVIHHAHGVVHQSREGFG